MIYFHSSRSYYKVPGQAFYPYTYIFHKKKKQTYTDQYHVLGDDHKCSRWCWKRSAVWKQNQFKQMLACILKPASHPKTFINNSAGGASSLCLTLRKIGNFWLTVSSYQQEGSERAAWLYWRTGEPQIPLFIFYVDQLLTLMGRTSPQLNHFTLQSLAMQLSALILIKSWCKKSQLPCCKSGAPAYFNLVCSFSLFIRCNSSHLFL